MKKMVLINIITIIVLIVIGVLGFYFWNNATSYVSTDNAKIDGDQMKIASPTAGEIKSFDAKQGDKLKKGDKVAEVVGQGQDGQSKKMSIKMPKDGTIVKTDGMEGSMAQAGNPIAYAYNLDDLYVTANVDEKDVADIEKGNDVDIDIDGQKATVSGKVEQIGDATANSFSLMPSSNSDGNYTKVSQVVPVKISLDSEPSKNVVPGMNAEVKIHKN
ncbi:HlyD family efflux transporter periplasmic adaptor subunit [Staphylococcus pasteuri]|uniref:HlyD family efflux transporter periplasmic adaptor subunit n=1 Tax=Staphylococcus TaxID=1279 RepID=UPI00030B998B|nr:MULTISPECIES: HlyD family efflux transporter periplasmic adaptor subunit [Staphylococcus]ODB60594.1 multidrug efflux protein [Staphylococcus sp. AOAB]MBL3399254.1 HlyD family secretion protein [Staphylococcus pasteuri]MBM6508145.1 HlyD family secretion protein [Staphylococcus pasteuri]MCO0861321.1 HlyD family efflux transporter periplasmic adaptor subunit [Staphylococcus pasteuri]MCO5360428.1 HlyD family efflux transporter periplasmic adaptor subunit [Staphylococcus pasteuri]